MEMTKLEFMLGHHIADFMHWAFLNYKREGSRWYHYTDKRNKKSLGHREVINLYLLHLEERDPDHPWLNVADKIKEYNTKHEGL